MASFPDDAPQEFKDHLLAAMTHMAGHGPHPGKYKGPPLKHDEEPDENEISELDLQHAREEPLEDERPHEASYKKMQAARTGGGGLGPSQMQGQQVQQTGAIQQQAATQSQVQAAQKQAAMIPQAPSPAGVQTEQAPPAAPGGGQAPPGTPGGSTPVGGGPQED